MKKPAAPGPSRRMASPIATEPPPAARPRWGRAGWLGAAAVAVAAVVAFAPVVRNGWVDQWDDQGNFLANPAYRGLGAEQVAWAWRTRLLGVYQPLAWMGLEAQYVAFGLDARGYHAVSLGLHAAVSVLLYALILALLARGMPEAVREHPARSAALAALASALFAAHPLRTEVVAWASCQPYLPCALFALGSVLAYVRSADGGAARLAWYAASVALAAAAMLSKAVAVTLPAVLIVLDVHPLRRLGPGRWGDARAWVEKLPFLALGLGFAAYAATIRQAALSGYRYEDGPLIRLAQSCYGLVYYLAKTIVPTGLIAYNFRPTHLDPLAPQFAGSLAAVMVVAAATYAARRRWPALAAALAAYAIVLSPNLGLVPTGDLIVADRYSYLASAGLAAALAAGLVAATRRRPGATPALLAIGLAALAALVALSWRQAATWRDQESLWSHAIAVGSGRDADLRGNLAKLRIDRGQAAEGLALLRDAAARAPDDPMAHYRLGLALAREKRRDEAVAELEAAIRLRPEPAEAHDRLGAILAGEGRHDAAREHFARAVELDPRLASARANLGMELNRAGRFSEALPHLAEAVRLAPDNAAAHRDLGVALAASGRADDAEAELAEAVRLDPSDATARNNYGLILARRGRIDEATAQFRESARLRPDYPDAHLNLGTSLAQRGRLADAEREFAEALRLKPDYPEARNNLAAVRRRMGK